MYCDKQSKGGPRPVESGKQPMWRSLLKARHRLHINAMLPVRSNLSVSPRAQLAAVCCSRPVGSDTCGDDLRTLRKVHHTMLKQQQSVSSRKIYERESVAFLDQLLHKPSDFLESAEHYALSIIFTGSYGVRLASLKHPVVVELFSI
jgi:hypothetical protein